MDTKKVVVIFSLVCMFACSGKAMANVDVTTTSSAVDLVSNILGSGITVSNETLVGELGQQGTFTGGLSAGIGIESGIILTSGGAELPESLNTEDSSGFSYGTPGDAQLDALVGGGTGDANILEFDFETTTGTLAFDYVFGSEEYNEFVGSSFNDVFAFFVNDVNIAELPTGSDISEGNFVAIDTANLGTNPTLYNNNDIDDGGPFFDIAYDGFTDVFTATVSGLDTSATHHIKLAIADRGDFSFDSGVFIRGGSVTDNPEGTVVPEPTTVALLGIGLVGLAGAELRRRRKKAVDHS